MSSRLSKKDLFSYGMLALPLAFVGTPLYIYAPDFYARNYQISLSGLGIALLILRMIDAIQDPVFGFLSDKYAQYRPRIIVSACCILVISFFFLFHPMTTFYLTWFVIFVFLATSCFSLVGINLNSLGGLWSTEESYKVQIVTYREFFSLIGLMLAVILPNLGVSLTIMSLLLVIISALALWRYWRWQQQHQELNQPSQATLDLKIWLKLKAPVRQVFLIYSLSMLASSIPAALVIFFIRDRLQLEEFTGLFLAGYFLSAVLGLPLWKKISDHYSKEHAWFFGMGLAIASFVWAYTLDAGDALQYLLICIISGIALGAELVIPPAMLADSIHSGTEKQASLQFGLFAFLGKLALALAVAISFSYLDVFNFVPASPNTPEALEALSFMYAPFPCLIKAFAALLLWRYIRHYKMTETKD